MEGKVDKLMGGVYREDDASKYFVENGYTLELWYKGQKMHEWSAAAPVIVTGNPYGAWLGLWRTYTI